MKRVCFVAIALVGLLSPVWSQGQTSVNYWTQAFIRVTDSAAGAAKLGNFGYQEGISILGAWVDKGEDCKFSIYFAKDGNYMIVAGGDNDAQDINVEIQNQAGRTIASEDREAPDAMVTFTPSESDYYTLRLSLAKSRQNLPCLCVMCVLRQNGLKVPLRNLDDCANKL